jgi:DnaJ-class molecular chaperone
MAIITYTECSKCSGTGLRGKGCCKPCNGSGEIKKVEYTAEDEYLKMKEKAAKAKAAKAKAAKK